VFTARYGLIPYIKQITFSLLKVNKLLLETNNFVGLLCNLKHDFFTQSLRGREFHERRHSFIHNLFQVINEFPYL